MSVTSANIDDLHTFVQGSRTAHQARTPDYDTCRNLARAVLDACPAGDGYYVPSNAPSMGAVNDLLQTWRQNHRFVNVIRQDLIEANTFDEDGTATIPDSVIAGSLADAGVSTPPSPYDMPELELLGSPPYSGFVDDPICLANGNFLLPELDLELPGVAGALSVVRTYNSRGRLRRAIFGPGWSTLADATLTVTDRVAELIAADGGGALFAAREDGTFAPNHRRGLSLHASDTGWVVRRGHECAWHFDGDGVLVRLQSEAADVVVERSPGTIRLVERASGRSVTYELDAVSDLVHTVSTSDGRRAAYRYDDHGNLVAVDRPAGAVTYGIDDGGFLAVVTDADGVVLCRNVYDSVGRVLSQVEHHGRETTYQYDDNGVATVRANDGAPPNVMVHDRRGRMTAMIDGLGHTMRVAYDDHDHVVQIVDRTGAETRFAYDERGNMSIRTYPDGLTETFEWDELDRLVARTDRAGHVTRYRYEAEQRSPAVVVNADGAEIRTTYNDLELPISLRDADGVTASFEWTGDGCLQAIVDGLGHRTVLDHDAAGRSVRTVNPVGVAVSIELDDAGRVQAVRSPDGELAYEYSAAGRPLGGALMNGNRWRATLDPAGEIQKIVDGEGERVTLERDLVGNVTAAITADGGQYRYEYDPIGRAVAVVDPDGNRTEAAFDPDGRATQIVDPTGLVRSREVDALGRTVMEVRPGGGTTRRTYHPNGELASHTDPEGHEWTYEVDAMGRVVSSTDPLGGVTTYRYTPAGRLAEVRSPAGRVLRREYDAAGRLHRVVEPDGTEVLIERRADGQVARTVRGGVVTSVDYDDVGRRQSIAGPWSTVAVEHEAGDTTSLTRGATHPARFAYSPRSRLERFTDPAGVVTSYTADARGQLVGHTTGDATMTYGYSAAGRLTSTTDPYGNVTRFHRDGRGAVVAVAHPDGTSTAYQHGLDGLVQAILDASGATLVDVERDQNGAVTAARAGDLEAHVRRDPLGRVTMVETDAGAVDYTWDADGYLVSIGDSSGHRVELESDDGVNVSAFLLADGTRIPAPEAVELSRDEAGRVLVDEHGRTHRYDLAGRLAATTANGATTSYEYDDLGLLSTEHTPSGVRTYRYGRAGELVELVDDEGPTASFDHDAAGRRTAQRRDDGTSTTYGWDDLGRLVTVAGVDGEGRRIRHEIQYDPFGRPAFVDGTPVLWDRGATGRLLGIGDQRFLWAGSHVRVLGDAEGTWDRRVGDDPWGDDGATGLRIGYRGELALDELVFFQDRVYDTRTRTFLSRDPLPSDPGAVTFAGIYSFAWCDPVNYVDPTGRKPLSDEEFSKFLEDSTKGFLDKVPWDKVAVAVVSAVALAVATAVAPGIGTAIVAGILIGAASGAANAVIDGKQGWDIVQDAAIGGLIGGLTGGIGAKIPLSSATSTVQRIATNTVVQAPLGYGEAAASEYADSHILRGGDGSMDWGTVAVNGTINTVAATGGGELGRHLDDAVSISGAANDLMSNPLEIPGPRPSSPLTVVQHQVHTAGPPSGMSQHSSGFYIESPPPGFTELPSGLLVPSGH